MEVMDLVWYLVVGGVIGWLASIVMGTNGQMGILANIFVGILGAALGAYLGPKLGIVVDSTLSRVLVMVGGAVLVILLLKLLRILR